MTRTLSIMLGILVLLTLAIVPALAQEGPDEWESNDEMDLADSIDGFVIEGEIGRHGDEDDWFVLEGQEGYHPRITLYYDEDRCDIDLEVYSGDEYVGSLTSTDSPDSGEFDVPDTCYIHVYIYDGHGDYTIEIEPQGDRDRDRDRDRRPRRDCEGPDEIEPNDTRRNADYIDDWDIEGYACEGDEDWYELGGQEGYYPYIEIWYDSDVCDIDVEIYSDHDLVGSLSAVEAPDGDEFDVPRDCYLRVFSFDGEGEYYIEIEPESDQHEGADDCEGPDEWEPNDDWDLADRIDGYLIEGYACEGDDDWFVLDGQEGTRPTISLDYDDRVCDIDLEVWSDDEIVGTLESSDAPDWDDFRVPGECYIHVYSYDGEGWYEIEIEP